MDKRELRQHMRRRLVELGGPEITRRSHLAAMRLIELPEFSAANIIMAYLPMPQEADPTQVLLAAWRLGKRIAVPSVDWESRQMLPIEIRSADDGVTLSPQGVPQPPDRPPIPMSEIDLVIVPGLAFDESGHRLGRGKGFYDRFLSLPELRAVTCGFCVEPQVVPGVPTEALDRRLSMLVTDSAVRRFAAPH